MSGVGQALSNDTAINSLDGIRTETLPTAAWLSDPVQPDSKKGKGRTGPTGPHEVDRGRVEAKTQTRMIGTAPTEITNPVGSTALVGFVAFRSRDPSCPSLVPSPLVCGVPNIFIMRQDSV